MEEIESRGETDHVAEDVGVTFQGRALKAMLRNGIANVLDGEVGGREGVAVRVEKPGVLIFTGIDIERGKRREGGRRCRMSGRISGSDSGRGLRISG